MKIEQKFIDLFFWIRKNAYSYCTELFFDLWEKGSYECLYNIEDHYNNARLCTGFDFVRKGVFTDWFTETNQQVGGFKLLIDLIDFS